MFIFLKKNKLFRASFRVFRCLSYSLLFCFFFNQVTFNLCKSLVDEWILVTEEEISKAVYHFIENHHKVSKKALLSHC